MIKEIVMVTQVLCADTKVNNTIEQTQQMTSADFKAYNTAQTRCGQIYKSSPCVKNFEIYLDPWGQRGYRITCYQREVVKPGLLR